MNKRSFSSARQCRHNALALALMAGLGFTGFSYGQSTSGTIFGTAQAAAGQTVTVTGTSGTTRSVEVSADGRYAVSNLPIGSYTVTLNSHGSPVSSRNDVRVAVGTGTEVDFALASSGNVTNLQALDVSANAPQSIDVSSVIKSTIITAEALARLPVGRSAEAIALLSPGTIQGSAMFGAMSSSGIVISMGGSGVSENSYYANGFTTGEPYRNIGGFQLPYGSISQQQTLAGGFSAKYGRSDGGVLSQIGKRGTNEWHFGGQITWVPRFARSAPVNEYYPTVPLPQGQFPCADPTSDVCIANGGTEGFSHESDYDPGKLLSYNADDKGWSTVYDAYVGGPLIKDKLFVFLSAEYGESSSTATGSNQANTVNYSSGHDLRYYGKVDWNINDYNIFEGTFLESKSASGIGDTYYYDYDTHADAGFKSANNSSGNNAKFLIGQYTSYLSDAATLSIIYGKGDFSNPTYYAALSPLPLVGGGKNQNPAYWGSDVDPNQGITNVQTVATQFAEDASSRTRGLRVDFNYLLGYHNLGVGIDNMVYQADRQSGFYTGGDAPAAVGANNPLGAPLDGTRWIYYHLNSGAYVVRYLNIASISSQSMEQKAYYFQDIWQVTSTLQMNLGLRNDHYTNYNNNHVAFVDEKNQWEPRLGFSWDVKGDSSFRVFGNAGRYYLALPANAANRAATASTYIQQYFHYSGIDENGLPLGLSPAPELGTLGTEISSPDGETGVAKDPKQVTAINLRPMFIDQYNLGFDKKLGENWVYGAKLSYRDLKTTIDDECSPERIAAKMVTMGLDPADYDASLYGATYCRLVNPSDTSKLAVLKNGTLNDYVIVSMSQADWGFTEKAKRTNAALDLYVEHPFDGTWYGRIDYTYTYARGNTAGQTRPDFGQADVSKTEDWDSWQLMDGATGELFNSRKHIFRFRGVYQITPDWLVSTTGIIQSGSPRSCLGYFGADALGDPTGYNGGTTGNYHWCGGQKVTPGSDSQFAGHQPWTYTINLGVRYSPSFADHKLTFGFNVFNVLNQQRIEQGQASLVATPHQVSNFYNFPISRQTPRYVRLTLSYDF